MAMKTFGEVLESADALSLEEQEDLLSVLQNRVRDQRRAALTKTVLEARREFATGRLRPTAPSVILKKILA